MKGLGQIVDPHEGPLAERMSKIIGETLDLFAADVALGRKLTKEQVLNRYALNVDNSLKGGVVMGAEAVTLGLADEIGSLNDTLQAAADRTSTRERRPLVNVSAKKGIRMDEETLALLGLEADATPEQIRAAMKAQTDGARSAEKARHQAAVNTALGLTQGDGTMDALTAQAADGRAYRESLLDDLERATVRAHGNGEAGQSAAARARRVWAGAAIADLKEQVGAVDAQADETVPGGRVSVSKGDKTGQPVRRGRY